MGLDGPTQSITDARRAPSPRLLVQRVDHTPVVDVSGETSVTVTPSTTLEDTVEMFTHRYVWGRDRGWGREGIKTGTGHSRGGRHRRNLQMYG